MKTVHVANVVCQGYIKKAEDVQHSARDVINVTRESILQWFVEQNDTEREAYIHLTILCLKLACSS